MTLLVMLYAYAMLHMKVRLDENITAGWLPSCFCKRRCLFIFDYSLDRGCSHNRRMW